MSILAVLLLGASFAWAVFTGSGVWSREWSIALVGIALAGVAQMLAARREKAGMPGAVEFGLLVSFLGLAWIQLLPLPAATVSFLSPVRGELAKAVDWVAGPQNWVTLSAMPASTLEVAASVTGYVVVFSVIRDVAWRWEEKAWAVFWPLLAVAGLQAALGMAQFYTGVGPTAFARGSYENRNHFAGLLELVLPIAIMYALAQIHRKRNRFETPAGPALKCSALLTLATLLLVAIIHSLSRMGFLAALGGMFTAGSLALGRGLGGSKRWIPVSAVGVAVLLAFIFLPIDPLIARFAHFAATEEITSDTRAQIWRETLWMIRDFPAFGCGLGSYEWCFQRYKAVAPMHTVDYAHNDYLQVMAEMGIPGFAIGLAFAALILGRSMIAAEGEGSLDERYLALGCTGSLMALALHSFVDFNLYIPPNAMAVAWVMGAAAALHAPKAWPGLAKATARSRSSTTPPAA